MCIGGSCEEYGISSFIYRADRPFHPERLTKMLASFSFPGVLRSKGFVWSAGNNENAVEWSSAGLSAELKPGPRWLIASAPEEKWPERAERFKARPQGDRRSEIVFIGSNMVQDEVRKALDGALVNRDDILGMAKAKGKGKMG